MLPTLGFKFLGVVRHCLYSVSYSAMHVMHIYVAMQVLFLK